MLIQLDECGRVTARFWKAYWAAPPFYYLVRTVNMGTEP